MAAITSAQTRPDADPQDQDKVILEGLHPQTVWVRVHDNGPTKHAECSKHHDGPWHRRGIEWKCPQGTDDSMFITLKLKHVIGIDCDPPVLYSKPFGKHDSEQYCAIPPSETHVIYSFNVELPSHTDIDPKIVVTPITE
jgi:hypothetical protein